MAISKKVKTNESTDIKKEFPDDNDTWNPDHYDRDNSHVKIENKTLTTKY